MEREIISYNFVANQAKIFLHKFYRAKGKSIKFPILIEKMADFLGYEIVFSEMEKSINAKTEMLEKQIVINNYLNPKQHPEMNGRYKFTVAHEIAHIVLHEQKFIKMYETGILQNDYSVLDKMVQNPRYEKEAEIFAGNLILPRELLKKEFTQRFGTNRIVLKNNYFIPLEAEDYFSFMQKKTGTSQQALQIAMKEAFILQVAS
ncbi:MAG: ImmA/IrrE family metallo-endopeptidase [Candidatus Cloacimonetes bacterium]|nr:ImmA/IrrE family metallo-endopeptidase [Candidatus Cloacimonadota bacterium]